jgi:hypothetical protein
MTRSVSFGRGFLMLLLAALSSSALATQAAAESRRSFEVELGAAWQARNDFAVPGDRGTQVFLPDAGPFLAARATVGWDFGERWSVRVLAAPLAIDTDFTSPTPIVFRDATFPAAQPLTAHYEFNSYRFTFFYRFRSEGRWSFRGGFTGKVRDARIRLSGAGLSETKDDLGFVPLLYGGARYDTGEKFAFDFEVDALGASQGRAIDASARTEFRVSESVRPYLGYRILDGGADNDEVLTFATLHYAIAGVYLRF